MKYKHVAWDWNGTILNDCLACAMAVDKMFRRRSLGSVSMEEYQKRITFPVINLYYQSGFDFKKESYTDVCDEYIANYRDNKDLVSIHKDAPKVLSEFSRRDLRQHIISASEQGLLEEQVREYGLYDYFDTIFGQKDHQADSKLHLAQRLVAETGCDPKEVLFIGDTTHDYEVATEAGFDCVLIANGHCSRERLVETGAPVFSKLEELLQSEILRCEGGNR